MAGIRAMVAGGPGRPAGRRQAKRLLLREFLPWMDARVADQRLLHQALAERQQQMEAAWAAARPLIAAVCAETEGEVPGPPAAPGSEGGRA